jgi:hypothetical protein
MAEEPAHGKAARCNGGSLVSLFTTEKDQSPWITRPVLRLWPASEKGLRYSPQRKIGAREKIGARTLVGQCSVFAALQRKGQAVLRLCRASEKGFNFL